MCLELLGVRHVFGVYVKKSKSVMKNVFKMFVVILKIFLQQYINNKFKF